MQNKLTPSLNEAEVRYMWSCINYHTGTIENCLATMSKDDIVYMCAFIMGQLLSTNPQLSIPFVTAMSYWQRSSPALRERMAQEIEDNEGKWPCENATALRNADIFSPPLITDISTRPTREAFGLTSDVLDVTAEPQESKIDDTPLVVRPN